jgi:FAD/FMN-containing dehydrogenase
MAFMGLVLALVLISRFFSCYLSAASSATSDGFIQCLTENIPSELIFTPGSNDFTGVLVSTIRNSRFSANTTVKPICIVTVTDASHVQAAVRCGRTNGVRLRARSGGHDYEGLSYRSERPEMFAVVDLANLRAITVITNELSPTAWVDSGATVGELYYNIAKNNTGLAFPAGVCTTLGVGGHFSGGGIGSMMRKYGLSIDNIVDAKLVDANGDLLDSRVAMGEDLFWAIRGGGGESFGIVVSWKVRLVKVPSTVAVFRISRTLEKGAINIVTKWQHVGPTLPDDINMEVLVQGQQIVFQSLYLGTCDEILPTIATRLPELNATRADCSEMTWLESTAFMNFGNTNTTALLDRNTGPNFFKNKSDYVRRAMAKGVWRKILMNWFAKNGSGLVILEPHGGFISSIPAGATPYPHRSGVLYNIQYVASWSAGDDSSVTMNWINNLYDFMGQYVTKSPREAYVNFRDLDIGENTVVNDFSAFDSGKVWGEKYFCSNFHRLATVKGNVDPTDYFRNEQSIPPLLKSI